MTRWNMEPLANCWTHAGDTTPFRGAHGHRHWSAWSIENRIEELSRAGFEAIGLFHDDLAHVLERDGWTLEGLDELLRDHGIEFVELEFLIEWASDRDDPRRRRERETRELLVEAANALDANHVKVGNNYPRPGTVLRERFAQLCDEFAAVETEVGFEPRPLDPNLETLADALEVVNGADNGGLYLDLWHLVKMDIPNGVVANLSADDIVAVEFEDGYLDTEMDLFEESINLRKLPGEGEFDIKGFIGAVRETGFRGPWGVEILSEEFRRFSMADAYPRAYESCAAYLRTD